MKKTHRDDKDWKMLKAQSKLAKELDIKRFINNLHFMQNALNFLTTERQRKLLRMKADKNVIFLEDSDKELLAKPLDKLNLRELT